MVNLTRPEMGVRPPPPLGDGPGYPLPCLRVIEPHPEFALRRGVKRYPEPTARHARLSLGYPCSLPERDQSRSLAFSFHCHYHIFRESGKHPDFSFNY